jgi:sialic acid synthase
LRELTIDGTRIADDTDCYVIAEIGHNHQGNLATCKELFHAAKLAGCDAVKLQKRDNKTLYTNEFYNSPYNSENAYGPTYGLHREALEFNETQYYELQQYAVDLGITFFATAFDIPSAEFLAEINMPAVKIASGDLTNIELLEWMAGGPDWPIIVSTGGGTIDDLVMAEEICQPDAVLHCTSGYPAKYDELNLRCIETLGKISPDAVIGWSGHDTGIAMAPVAFALGARIIEKHFTLNRAWKGTDQAFSLEPQGMKTMIDNLRDCKAALGDGIKRVYPAEIEALKKQRKNAQGQIDGISL